MPWPLPAQQGSTLSQLFSEILFSVPLRVGDIFLVWVSWPIYNMCFKNMPGLTIQCLLKTWKRVEKGMKTNKTYTSLMYSFSIKSHTKISTSLVPDSRVKVKATELCFHFSIGSVSKRQRWGHFEEAQAGDQHKPVCVCTGRHHYMWPAPPHRGRRRAPETMKKTFFNIRNTGHHELSTQTVLRAMCPSYEPQMLGRCLLMALHPFPHPQFFTDQVCPCPLEPYSLLMGKQSISCKRTKNMVGEIIISGCVTCFRENFSI